MAWNPEKITALLLEAGKYALEKQRGLTWEFKEDRSLVTEVDREVEALLTRELEDEAAGTRIIGEETIATKGEEYIAKAFESECFVIDPIDGTVPYAHQMPTWGVSVGRMVAGELVDGAVYMPAMRELVLSVGEEVREGRLVGDAFEWAELAAPMPDMDQRRLVHVTQAMAKYGRVEVTNPLMTLGAAVVPLVGLLQGRFVSYLGSVKLWDVAGALPLLLRKGFSITVEPGGIRREVTSLVSADTYHLASDHPRRWQLRTNLLVCHPADEKRFRGALVRGDQQ